MDTVNGNGGVYSVSISARVTLEMHSLNNEGGEGNQIATRMVTLVTPEGNIETVNAVSGDMLKHIQAAHLHRLAGEQDLPLSEGTRMFNPNRINIDIDKNASQVMGMNSLKMIDWLLRRDAVSDMEGILITAGNRALGRKSVVEFGWLVGLPDRVRTDNFLHTKYVPDSGKPKGVEQASQAGAQTPAGDGSNLGQNLFYRPASSGIYALVLNIEPARIGFNDISQSYAIGDDKEDKERVSRYRALIESVLYTLIQPRGAMRNTQNPHVVACEGVVTWSTKAVPAPTISPLNDCFSTEIKSIAAAMNEIIQKRPKATEAEKTGAGNENPSGGEVKSLGDAVEVKSFSNLGDLAKTIGELLELRPYRIVLPQANTR